MFFGSPYIPPFTPRALSVTVLIGLLGCGGGGNGDTGSDTTSTVDIHTNQGQTLVRNGVEEGTFQSVIDQNADLKTVVDGLKTEGFSTFLRGTHMETDGATVVDAGLYVHANGGVRTAMLWCTDGDCTAASASSSEGQYNFQTPSGFTPSKLPLPLLQKKLVKGEGGSLFDLNNPTETVPAGLTIDSATADFAMDDPRVRILTPLGTVFDTTTAESLLNSAAFSGISRRSIVHGASLQDVEDMFTNDGPTDIAIWLTESVQQTASTGPSGDSLKAVGLSVALDPMIDETLDYKELKEILKQSPFYGPGVLVLLGCSTLSDPFDSSLKDSMMKEINKSNSNDDKINYGRLLVGFSGCDKAETLIGATQNFMNDVMGGESLATANAAVNDWLHSMGSTATLVSVWGADQAPDIVLPRVARTGWAGRSPAGGKVIGHLQTLPECQGPSGKYFSDETDTGYLANPLSWSGDVFRGSYDSGGTTGEIVGYLPDPSVGQTFYFAFHGSPQTDVFNVVFYAEAKIEEVEETTDTLIVRFGGIARTTAFQNDLGETCDMKSSPNLYSPLGDLSRIEISF
jgi:hypothetical protein